MQEHYYSNFVMINMPSLSRLFVSVVYAVDSFGSFTGAYPNIEYFIIVENSFEETIFIQSDSYLLEVEDFMLIELRYDTQHSLTRSSFG